MKLSSWGSVPNPPLTAFIARLDNLPISLYPQMFYNDK